ncbi:MAG: response regulator [Oculatellaceae cyanobacterium bins.114]|nr:response regulator [Oculatellaceae cyanobacterium bins.114]
MSSPIPTILVIDDSLLMQEMIKQAIGDRYQLLTATNAIDALSLLASEPVSVVLLDISMPEIDGYELCRTLRNLPQFRHLPIIMLTARDGVFDRVQGRLAGATEYLTKPFDAARLNYIIERSIQSGTHV